MPWVFNPFTGNLDWTAAGGTTHSRLHALASMLDHNGGITPGKIFIGDVNGLPGEGTNTDLEVASAVSLKHSNSLDHVRQHAITSTSDHTSSATAGQVLKADASGLPVNATNTNAEVASAVSLKHSNATDHAVGASIASSISDSDLTHSPDGNSVFDALALKAPLDSPIFTTKITTPIILAPGATLVLKPTTDATTAVQIADKDGNAILTVDTTNDRVGIGTTGPGAKLDVLSSDADWAARILNSNTTGGNGLLVRSNNAGAVTATFGVYANGAYRMWVQSDGNVGIGTTGPGNTLDINGGLIVSGTAGIGLGSYGNAGKNRIDSSGPASQVVRFIGTNDGYTGINALSAAFGSYAGTAAPSGGMIISGNVGIGTTVPTAVLHLKAGTATASTAPLKLTSGTVNTTPEAGAIEFDGTNLFMTI
jgi:hypothetical protein